MQNTTKTAHTDVIDAMFKAGAHFGYSRARRHASVKPFLYGSKNGVDIIDLEQTAEMLHEATQFIHSLGKAGKPIVFVGTKSEIKQIVELAASELEMPYVTSRWVGGILTNWPEIKKRTARLKELSSLFEKGELEKYTKKERLLFERELETLKAEFGGIANLEGAPGALVIIDPREEHIAVTEARKVKVPTVSLLNSDCNKSEITYPVLANDAALESVRFFLSKVKEAYQQGAKEK